MLIVPIQNLISNIYARLHNILMCAQFMNWAIPQQESNIYIHIHKLVCNFVFNKKGLVICNYLYLWLAIINSDKFVLIIINNSDTSNAQSRAGTASKIVSGNGLYWLRSGTRSWTTAKDVVVIRKFTINNNNAKKKKNNNNS